MAHFFAVIAGHQQAQFAQQQIINVVHQHFVDNSASKVSTRLLVQKENIKACTLLDADCSVDVFLARLEANGLAGCHYLEGAFQGVTFDPVQQQWLIFNSPFHPTPLYYCRYLNCLIVSQRLSLIELFVTPKCSTTALTQWLSGRPDPNMSMFDNIAMLPFAHIGYYDPNIKASAPHFDSRDRYASTLPCIHLTRFWDIDPQQHIRCADIDEYAQRWQHILASTIQHHVNIAQANIGCQMSGGLDSTSIIALLNNTLNSHVALPHDLSFTPQLIGLSHTYTRSQTCDESVLIDAMRAHLHLQQHHHIELDRYTDYSFAQLYPTQLASPGTVHSPKYEQELALLASLDVDMLLTGNGGDEMAWGHSLVYADRIAKGDVSVIKDVINTAQHLNVSPMKSLLQLLVKPNLPDAIVELLGQYPSQRTVHPPWLTPTAIAHLATMQAHNPFDYGLGHQAKAARYEGVMQTATFNSMRSYESLSRQHNIQVRHPFFSTDLAQFSFAIPQSLLLKGPYPKYLLRKSMHSMLPEAVCWNKHKVIFDQHFATLIRTNRHHIRQLLQHTALHDLGLIDNAKVMQAFDAVIGNPQASVDVNLLYLILTQSWYQRHIEC